MKISKTMIAAGLVTTVATGSIIGTSLASAHTTSNQQSIVDKIAEKFSLNTEDVQAVFDEAKEERHQEIETKRAEHIATLVAEGTLTQEQADLLKVKHEELHAARNSLKEQDLTKEEFHEQMKALKEEFNTWAEEQGINLESIRPDNAEDKARHGFRKHEHKGGDYSEQ